MKNRSVFWKAKPPVHTALVEDSTPDVDMTPVSTPAAAGGRVTNPVPIVDMTPVSTPAAAGGRVTNPVPVVEMTPVSFPVAANTADVEMEDADNSMQL